MVALFFTDIERRFRKKRREKRENKKIKKKRRENNAEKGLKTVEKLGNIEV